MISKLLTLLLIAYTTTIFAQKTDLAGKWHFKADSADIGISQKWHTQYLDETVDLPGSMASNNKGDEVSVKTLWTGQIVDKSWFTADKYAKYRKDGNVKIPYWLQPVKYYKGAAWYKRNFQVTEQMAGKPLLLKLERVHWESTVWIDDKEIGTQNSLGTSHEFNVAPLKAGVHTITVRVDNRIKDIDMGHNAHSVSDHTQSNWNGITGEMSITTRTLAYVESVRTFPSIKDKCVEVEVTIDNSSDNPQNISLSMDASSEYAPTNQTLPAIKKEVTAPSGKSVHSFKYDMGDEFYKWDEFNPYIYTLNIVCSNGDKYNTSFGMRELEDNGSQFLINGNKVFLRGTLDCAAFPKTGYPPTDIQEWVRIYKACKDHGLNHVRFHSWCPPKAAFEAADRMGVYIQVESGGWCTVGDSTKFDTYTREESERILKKYGNHPSFILYTYGNEPNGKNQAKFLGNLITDLRKVDPRHKYTSAAGWPYINESDYHNVPEPRMQGWGEGLKSIINSKAPSTNYDWSATTAKHKKTHVSHEVGQWCVYPNFKEISKYDGVMKARNFEIFEETLKENGMIHLADSFLLASGKLQTLCYKVDIEAALRTKDFGGFQLLGIYDFPGQGTALVGVLDAFYEEKGYVKPEEFRNFCNTVVPLARMEKMIFYNNENFSASAEIANYSAKTLKDIVPNWQIARQNGEIIAFNNFKKQTIPVGNCISIGEISMPLSTIKKAEQLTLTINVAGFQNSWNIWVYPKGDIDNKDVKVATKLDDKIIEWVKNGGKLLYTPVKGSIKAEAGGDILVGFSSIFWNTAWTAGQPPHTLGVLVDPQHPALKDFPTEYHSDFQWWDACTYSNAIIADAIDKDAKPIIRIIDDWFKNRSLGLVYEVSLGKGKIVISGIDFTTDIENRPAGKQLLKSIINYMNSSSFNPKITEHKLKEL